MTHVSVIQPSLVQIVVCRLVATKPLSEQILEYYQLGTNFSQIQIEIHIFSFNKMHLKILPAKWQPFCLGLNVLRLFMCLIIFPAVHSSFFLNYVGM